jgi:HlyD family secretion protein
MISASVAEIYDPATLQVRADVPLADAARLSSGQPVNVVFDLLPEHPFKGTVSSINGSADLTRNTLQCKIAMTEHEPRLRAAMIAKVTFLSPPKAAATAKSPGSASRQRIFVPKDALTQPHKDHFVVWIITTEEKAKALTVTPGNAQRNSDGQAWSEILEGLLPGQHVILNPPTTLKDGQRIKE